MTVASHGPDKVEMDKVISVLNQHCAKVKLMRLDETDKVAEMSFLVELTNVDGLAAAQIALQELSKGSLDITFLDNKGIW